MNIRVPAVAGLFYPEDAAELAATVQALLAEKNIMLEQKPRAIIVPHAGYIYSGAVAASAYRQVQAFKHEYKKVLLLGPSHRVAFAGVATPGCEVFRSPLGDVKLDLEAIEKLENLKPVGRFGQAHASEHSLEVHLPFLQCALGEFELVPLVVGDCGASAVSMVIEALFNVETLVVVSSDLSHFLNYEQATMKDRATSERIESLFTQLSGDQACGCRPINGLLQFCKQNALTVDTLDLCNSGDITGDHSRVVGYGAYVIH